MKYHLYFFIVKYFHPFLSDRLKEWTWEKFSPGTIKYTTRLHEIILHRFGDVNFKYTIGRSADHPIYIEFFPDLPESKEYEKLKRKHKLKIVKT